MKLARLFGYCVLGCFFMACSLLSLGFHPRILRGCVVFGCLDFLLV